MGLGFQGSEVWGFGVIIKRLSGTGGFRVYVQYFLFCFVALEFRDLGIEIGATPSVSRSGLPVHGHGLGLGFAS